MKDLTEVIGAFLLLIVTCLAFVAGLAMGYGLAGVFWGAIVLLITNVLLPLFDVHYELTLLQGFAAGIIIALVRTVLGGIIKVSK